MKFYNKLRQTSKYACFLSFYIFFILAANAQDKKETTSKTTSLTIKVVDDADTALPDAQINVGGGMIYSYTDENGQAKINAYPSDFIKVSLRGHEKVTTFVTALTENNTIILTRSKLYMTDDDEVPLPFTNIKKRTMTGSSYLIEGNQLEKYPSLDIRNSFTGLAPGLQVIERDGSTGISSEEPLRSYGITEKIGVYARGRNMIYIIDNLLHDVSEMPLDPKEIESVTVIKDIVAKAMYGPAGADGIIFIKTKRGRSNEKVLNIDVENGVSVIDRMPSWSSGADYAKLNNLARTNSGLAPKYSDTHINNYKKNDPYDMFYPSVNYMDMIIKNTKAFRRATVSSQGGSDAVQYYSNLVYNGEGDNFNIGSTADYNKISARTNLDIKINEFVKAKFDIHGGLTFRRSPNYGYVTSEGSAYTRLLEYNLAISDITNIPPVEYPVYANNSPELNKPWYAVSSAYPNNPIGNIMHTGYYTEKGRTGAANITLDYDMINILPGLKSQTEFNFNIHNLLRLGKSENYDAFILLKSVTPGGKDTMLLSRSRTAVDEADMRNLHDYYFQKYNFYENLSYEKSMGNHSVVGSLTYFIYKVSINGIKEPQRQQNAIFSGIYSFDDKYSLQAVLNYAGSNALEKQNRYEVFPSIGASWVISEENFMKNIKPVNYLKIRAEAGILGVERFLAPYLYQDGWTRTTGSAFGPYTAQQWFGSGVESTVYRTYPTRMVNPNLTWTKVKEFSVGIDALLFNKLQLEINYYNNLRYDNIMALSSSLPYIAGVSSALPYVNLNSTRFFGIETGIWFSHKINNFKYVLGGNATIQNSKLVDYNEPKYRYDYQYRTGTAADTYWGLTYLGKFQSDEEAMAIPQLFDEHLHSGDLKYKDMNGDGVVDDNDYSAIGHTSPRLLYALNAQLSYKNFELIAIGTGSAFFDLPLTNKYYWNGWGDNNYSDFVKDNIGGAYPKLTYYKVNNNFLASDFWLTKGDYFKVQNIELAYNIPLEKLQFMRSQGVRVHLRGANLLTISKIKDVDPESINSGVTVYPLNKTFTLGIKLTF